MKFLPVAMGLMYFPAFAVTQTGVKWNKCSKTFEPIPGLSTYDEERRSVILQSRQEETHLFNGQPLNLSYYEEPHFFEYYDNDTKVSGICGDIWTTLSRLLKFTLILSKSNEKTLGMSLMNGTYTGIVESARLNQTDVVPKLPVYITRLGALEFSPALWTNSIQIFAHGQWKRNRAWMFTLLSKTLWITISGFIVTLSLASIVTQRILIRYRKRKMDSENFLNHLFYSFAAMCNQASSSCEKTGSGSRILNLTGCIFGFLILAGYNSHLIYSMAKESFDAPFTDLQTLFDNTKFHVVVVNGSQPHRAFISAFAYPIFGTIREAKRLTVVNSDEDMYKKVCRHSHNFVSLDAVEAVAVRRKTECKFVAVGGYYYKTAMASGISRGVKNRKSLYVGYRNIFYPPYFIPGIFFLRIMKLREFGLLSAIKLRYMRSGGKDYVARQAAGLIIDMDRVLLIFCVFSLGVITSIIICLLENIIVKLRKTT